MGAQLSSDAVVCWGYCPPLEPETAQKTQLNQQASSSTVDPTTSPRIESSDNVVSISVDDKINGIEGTSKTVTVDISMIPVTDKALKTHQLRKQVADLEATIDELSRANQASKKALVLQQTEVEDLRRSMFDLRTDVQEVNVNDDKKAQKRSVSMERFNNPMNSDISNGGGGGGDDGKDVIEGNEPRKHVNATSQPIMKTEINQTKKTASGGGIPLSPVKEAPLAQFRGNKQHLRTVAIGTMGVQKKSPNLVQEVSKKVAGNDKVLEPSSPPPELKSRDNSQEARKSPNIAAVLARDHYNATRHRHIENLTAAMDAEDEETDGKAEKQSADPTESTQNPLDSRSRITVRRSTSGLAESIEDVDQDGVEYDDNEGTEAEVEQISEVVVSSAEKKQPTNEEEEPGAWELVAVRTALSVATSSSSKAITGGKKGYVENKTRNVTIVEGPIGLTFSSFSILPEKEKDTAAALGGDAGVVVTDVTPSGQASRHNVRLGDLIVSLNGRALPQWVDRDHFLEMLTLADRPLTMGVRSF